MFYSFSRFFLCLGLFLLPLLAQAQAAHAADAGAATVSVEINGEQPPNMFQHSSYDVRFIRNHATPDKVMLRLISNGDVTGCAHMTGNKVDMIRRGKILRMEITDSELELDNKDARYAHYDCDLSMNRAYVDILLDRDKLINDNVETISIQSEKYGSYADSDLDITKDRLRLTTHSNWTKSIYTYWFYPENTVILYAPHARQGEDIRGKLRTLGLSQGLIPLEESLKGFEIPVSIKTAYYFTDPGAKVTSLLQDGAESTTFGELTLNQVMYGPDGAYDSPYTIDVLARYPGQDD